MQNNWVSKKPTQAFEKNKNDNWKKQNKNNKKKTTKKQKKNKTGVCDTAFFPRCMSC